MANISEWKAYQQGDILSYNLDLERVQAKVTEGYFINLLVDFMCTEDREFIREFDKIVFIGNGKPVAIFPSLAVTVDEILPFVDSIKNTDIHTVLLSMDGDVFVDSDRMDKALMTLKKNAKMEVRFINSK